LILRAAAGTIALAVLATIVLRLQLNMSANGNSLPEAIWVIYRFFTVWTNTLVGVVCGVIALGARPPSWMTAGLVLAIGIVGGVYHAVLAQLVSYEGLDKLVDVMLHTVVPVGFAALWLFGLPKQGLGLRSLVPWLIYPLVYCVFVILRGLADGIYPYRFLNLAEIGAAQLAINVAGLLVAFVVGGLILLGIARMMTRAR